MKRNWKSFFDFLKLFQFRVDAFGSIFKILSDRVYFKFVFVNVLYSLPFVGKYLFLREVRKIVPTLKGKDLTYVR